MIEHNGGLPVGVKVSGGIVAVTALAGYLSAESIAERFIEKPVVPTAPTHVVAERAPINLGIGIDITPSPISQELPAVRQAVRDFVERGGVLLDGDTVVFCPFAENARCEQFSLPGQRDSLLRSSDGVQTERRKGIQTHVTQAVLEIIRAVETLPGENDLIIVWTDAKDEGPAASPGTSLDTPLRILVPKADFLPDANKVAAGLPGSDVDAAVVRAGSEVGDKLRTYTLRLDQEAQKKAQATADKYYQEAMAKYQGALDEYHRQLTVVKKKVASVKRVIRISLWAIIASIAALAGGTLYMRDRERHGLKGKFIQLTEGGYTKLFPLPNAQTCRLSDISPKLPSVVLKGSRDGIMLVGEGVSRILTDGEEVVAGSAARFFSSRPRSR